MAENTQEVFRLTEPLATVFCLLTSVHEQRPSFCVQREEEVIFASIS